MISKTATSGELAQVLGVTERAVGVRRQDGRLPLTSDDRIDLHAVIRAGVAALAVKPQSSDGRPDLDTEKARLASEQADQVAMKNAAMRRELVPLAEIGQAVNRTARVNATEPAALGRADYRLHQRPLRVRHVARVAQSASVCRPPMFRRPGHRHLRESITGKSESHPIPTTQLLSG